MWWTLLACQEPFGANRHDLVGFRIAAVSVPAAAPGDRIVPEAAVIVDGRPWAERPAELAWHWVASADEVGDIPADRPPDGTGAAPELAVPEDRTVLALIARPEPGSPVERRAFVALAPPPAALAPPTAIAAAPLDLELATVTADELALAARRAREPGPAAPIAPGGFARLWAEVGEGDPLVRWMATAGTFFELDRHTTDWVAGELWLDGDEIDEDVGRTPIEAGWVTFVALALGRPGETAWRALDLPVGVDGPVGVYARGRFVPADVPVAPAAGERVRGTLVADDASPIGLRLTGAEVEPDDGASPPLACAGGPFDPRALLDQRCGRAELDGVEVVVIP